MPRTPLFAKLQRILTAAHARNAAAAPPAATGPSRRQFLGTAAAAAALVPLTAACGDNDKVAAGDSVAIIGAGIAGLHCCYRLQQAGVFATVYEGSDRTGGRMFTARDKFAGGQIAELGGELIDSDHLTLMALADEFDIQLDNLPADTIGLSAETYYFDGANVDIDEIAGDFAPLAAMMATTVTTAEADDTEFARVDAMSISEWLETEAGLPSTSLIRRILELAYVGEFGLEADNQSVFNLLYLIDYSTPDPFRIFGDSDEMFHAHTGSQTFPDKLAEQVSDRIELGHVLTEVVAVGPQFRLTFSTPAGDREVTVDHVVFALPFTKLRQVALASAGLSADKLDIIEHLGMGTNAKLMMQFTARTWRTGQLSNGYSFSDVGELQSTWETSRGQDGDLGIITNFVGGDRGTAFGAGSAEARATEVLPWLDTLYPGAAAAYISGSALRQHWPTYEFTLGSYASYLQGQWSYFGMEGAREGNLHFCGEHTSEDYQGYMEGGAQTGAAVAAEILDDLGKTPAAAHQRIIDATMQLPQACYHGGQGYRLRRSERRRLRAMAPAPRR